MSHRENILKCDRSYGFDEIFLSLKKYMKGILPSKSEVLDIFGKIMINSFFIVDENEKFIGKGLYLGASIMDHSCTPNAVWISKGKELIIRCISKEKIENISDLRISYIPNLYESTERRKELLMEDYYFLCQCSR